MLSDGPNDILKGTLEGFRHESRDQRDRARETRLAMHKDAGFGVGSTDILQKARRGEELLRGVGAIIAKRDVVPREVWVLVRTMGSIRDTIAIDRFALGVRERHALEWLRNQREDCADLVIRKKLTGPG
jgi:hypothetical protein